MEKSKLEFQIDRQVFFPSVAVLLVLVGFSAFAPEMAGEFFQDLQNTIVTYGSWYYVTVVAIVLVMVLMLTVTRYGDIKLGPDHSVPDYSFVSWFAMLFSAGMGIGLMFFGVAEPVMHFLNPPTGEPGTSAAAAEAMKLTFFHWGIHAWAMYAIVALILAYFAYRHDLPLTLRSSLYPLIGDKIYGPWGAMIDIFAILGTVCGVATSLGLGVLQINSGLNYLFDIPVSGTVQVMLVIGTTILATISVLLGLDAGIKRLSELNIALAVLLLILVLSIGPTVYLLQAFVQNTGDYLSELVAKTFNLYAYNPTDWIGGWTIFYWGWWLSWAPFVGLFIARISRGRTIREFVLGAMFGPTLFTLFWMTVFGNSGIDLILNKWV
ncbi:MAG: choline/glycine/proline betaine transport protein, partial [Litorivivens sp.]